MIFYITHEFLDGLAAHKDKDELINNLDLVVRSHKDRKHYVELEDRRAIERLLSEFEMTHISKAGLKTKNHLTAYSRGYFENVCTYIELTVDSEDLKMSKINKEEKTVILLPIEKINISLVAGTNFLCEDISDVEIYNFIAKTYCDKMNMVTVNLSKDPIPGAGKNIAKIYDGYVKDKNKICFCISDSDCRYPGKISNTVTRIREIERNSENYLCYYLELPVHELENLIPRTILEKLPNHEGMLELVGKLNESERKCLDYKKGYTWKMFRNKSDGLSWEEDETSKYWADIFVELGMIRKEDLQVPEDKKPGAEIPIVRGMGNGMSKEALTLMKKEGKVIVEENLNEIWDDLGKKVFSWCIASEFRAI